MALQKAATMRVASRHRARKRCSCLCNLTTQDTQQTPTAADARLPLPPGLRRPSLTLPGSSRRGCTAGATKGNPCRGCGRQVGHGCRIVPGRRRKGLPRRSGLLGLPAPGGAGSAGGFPRTSLRGTDLTGTGKKPRRNSATPRASTRRQAEAKTPERSRILPRRPQAPLLRLPGTALAVIRPFPGPDQPAPTVPIHPVLLLANGQPTPPRGV